MTDYDPSVWWVESWNEGIDDDDGSDCWIRHDGMIGSSSKAIRYRIGSMSVWIPRSQIVATTSESIQVTTWLRDRRPELFRRNSRF